MTSLAMSENGRVLIPAAMRDELGFKPNSRILVEVIDGSLVMTSAAQHRAKMRAYFDKVLPPTPGRSIVDEFIAERRLEAQREDQE